MYQKSEQFSELQRKNLEAGMKLAQLSLDNSQRIVALQVEITKKLFQDSVENAKAMTSAKDPQQALALQTQYAQDAGQTVMDAARQIAELGSSSRAEFTQLLTEQFSNGGKDMMTSFQSLFSALPGKNTNVIDAMNQAMTTVNSAFEQFAKASATTFAPEESKTQASKRRQA